MPISHFFAEGIGPFKKIHLDLQGADGHPSPGPHILAGGPLIFVNCNAVRYAGSESKQWSLRSVGFSAYLGGEGNLTHPFWTHGSI
jgi:hypothetical protein